jgi:hypothetical protein
MRVPPAIKTVDALQHEISLLEFLDGVELTVSHARRNHVDDNHDRLKWALAPVETGDERFQVCFLMPEILYLLFKFLIIMCYCDLKFF